MHQWDFESIESETNAEWEETIGGRGRMDLDTFVMLVTDAMFVLLGVHIAFLLVLLILAIIA